MASNTLRAGLTDAIGHATQINAVAITTTDITTIKEELIIEIGELPLPVQTGVVTSYNGLTGAVQGVSQFNGATGAVSYNAVADVVDGGAF
jgi:hypothetical protein